MTVKHWSRRWTIAAMLSVVVLAAGPTTASPGKLAKHRLVSVLYTLQTDQGETGFLRLWVHAHGHPPNTFQLFVNLVMDCDSGSGPYTESNVFVSKFEDFQLRDHTFIALDGPGFAHMTFHPARGVTPYTARSVEGNVQKRVTTVCDSGRVLFHSVHKRFDRI